MHRYIFKRLLMLIPVIIGVSLLIFILMDLAPGNILDMAVPDGDPEVLARLEHEMGYDRSVFYRYFIYMRDLLKGDLGYSYYYKTDVWAMYIQRFPNTLKLAGASMLVCIVLSIPLGILAALKHRTIVDNLATTGALLGLSMPNFWLGLLLIILFSQMLGWLPSYGDEEGIKSLIMPAFTLGTGMMATLGRTTRSSMLDVLRQDYLRTARAKGVSNRKVVWRDALRNALIPIVTIIGTQLGGCLGGAVVTENVFSWPGIGQLLVGAIKGRDTTVVTGFILMSVIIVCIIQLLVDLLYAFIDPRLRSQYASKKKSRRPQAAAAKGGAV